MMEDNYTVHSPGVFEIRRAGKYSRKSAPPVVRAIPRTNKRFMKSPFSIEQMDKISLEYINPYKQIYRDAVTTYTEKKIKSRRKCELVRKIMFNRENRYFEILKKCVIYDTNWMREKFKEEKNTVISMTDMETKSILDIYMLRSVVNEKICKQRDLLFKLKEFWNEYSEKLKVEIDVEKKLVIDRLKAEREKNKLISRGEAENKQQFANYTNLTNNYRIDKYQDLSPEQLEQMKIAVTGYEVTIEKLSMMIESLTQRVELILAAEKKLNNVAKAIISNNER